jgi:hypothetical protein
VAPLMAEFVRNCSMSVAMNVVRNGGPCFCAPTATGLDGVSPSVRRDIATHKCLGSGARTERAILTVSVKP